MPHLRSGSVLLALIVLALGALGVLSACEPSGPTLLVDLRTDLVPGIEFTGVEVLLDGEVRAQHLPQLEQNYIGGIRVASLDSLSPGPHLLLVRLTRGVSEPIERPVLVSPSDTTVVTVVIARDCRGISCPGAGSDPSLSACLGGRCVRPECTPETPDACPMAQCTEDMDCPMLNACALPRCLDEVCLYESADNCGSGQYCDPQSGCIDIPMLADAGLAQDASVSDAGTPIDSSYFDATIPDVLLVEPTYASNPNWNDYVEPTDDARDRNHQPDVPCSSSAQVNGRRCVHGGERRRVATGRRICDGLTLADALDAFNWHCDDTEGQAIFYSQGLKVGRRLTDLLSGLAFASNRVTVFVDGEAAQSSLSETWWDNEVIALPTTGGSLDNGGASVGRIYVAQSSAAIDGIIVAENRVALTMSAGVELSQNEAAGPSCSSVGGAIGTPDINCMVVASGRSFLWVEGSFVGVATLAGSRGVMLTNVKSSSFRNLRIEQTSSYGLHLLSAYENSFISLSQSGSRSEGIVLNPASFNHFRHLRVADNSSNGMRVRGGGSGSLSASAHNVFHDVTLSNSGASGVRFDCGSRGNLMTQVLAVSNSSRGIMSVCDRVSTFSHITAAYNGRGIDFDQNETHTLAQALLTYNGSHGLEMDFGGGPHRVAQLVATDNGFSGVRVDATNVTFSDHLTVGSNLTVDCLVEGRSLPGLVAGTCTTTGVDGSSDYGPEASTAILRTERSAIASLRGAVTIDDATNPGDDAGLAGSVTDWLDFESPFRAWGHEAVWPDPLGRGRCRSDCRIYDWRIDPTDDVLWRRSGDVETQAPALVEGAPCPPAVSGDRVLTEYRALEILADGMGNEDGACQDGEMCRPPDTFLVNAMEIFDDGVGDEDGLCESDERCFYSPHFGAWQGEEGANVGPECVYDAAGGPVTNVRIFAR